ncbi:MAG: quinone-dependent dihydroorotate dehydrogenase [Wenzhouxiangellaceae bacterium]
MVYSLLRPFLHALPAEAAHALGLTSLAWASRLQLVRRTPTLAPLQLWGRQLPNPLGLAAGLDKNGDYIDALASLGFGFIEVGTVTPRPQGGNPKPRLFRLTEHQAVINRMGFNNHGISHMVRQLQRTRYQGLLGINIGKNKDTPNDQAASDYCYCLEQVYPWAGYITINLSSPNTAGLRDLQAPAALAALLGRIIESRDRARDQHGRHVPLVVKVAPDLNTDDIPATAAVIAEAGIEGVIATNTTIQRPQVQHHRHGSEAGGLSGAPLKALADATLKAFDQALPAEIVRIGCGGITCGQDAVDKTRLGAQLVQCYSGLIYRGPALINEICDALSTSRHNATAHQ